MEIIPSQIPFLNGHHHRRIAKQIEVQSQSHIKTRTNMPTQTTQVTPENEEERVTCRLIFREGCVFLSMPRL